MLNFLRKLFRRAVSPGSGADGERRAAEWLARERRFSVVARNWRNPRNRREEIDLVCCDGEVLVFVEVKSRAADALVPGIFAVNARKRRVLLRAARSYLAQLRERPRTFRLDVVEVAFAGASDPAPKILHFENVKLFPKHFR
ncbi:MAG TPA: YraN family protein [Opitutaceae bacterium]|nr:YraN family protein [Opitutaceae bacterium]